MVSNAQNCRHKSLELNPVPTLISDEDLEVNICKTLSLTGYKVKLDDIHACYVYEVVILNLNVGNK